MMIDNIVNFKRGDLAVVKHGWLLMPTEVRDILLINRYVLVMNEKLVGSFADVIDVIECSSRRRGCVFIADLKLVCTAHIMDSD